MKIEDYKDAHSGESAIVFGTGSSLRKYDGRFNDGCTLLGTNEIIYYHTAVDYYFIGDAGGYDRGYLSDPTGYDRYRPNIQKFYRIPDKTATITPRSLPQDRPGVVYYEATQKQGFRFYDTVPPFSDALSITFEALQFCLMAGFQKIFLVGHDCNYDEGSFKTPVVDRATVFHCPYIIESWYMFCEMVNKRYPDLEIVNVNPVSMNLFKCVRTESL